MRSEDFGTKPSNTKIEIAKNADLLEIYIPPFGLDLSLLVLGCFCIFWGGCILRVGFFTFSTPPMFNLSAFGVVLILPFLAIDILLGYTVIWTCFGKTYLRIDSPNERLRQRHEISLTRFIFGVKILSRQKPIPKRNISKIILVYKHYCHRAKEFIPAELKFETDRQTIRLGGKESGVERQDEELEWLAYEISEWLDKHLTTIGNSQSD
jgi:hypothetical protein